MGRDVGPILQAQNGKDQAHRDNDDERAGSRRRIRVARIAACRRILDLDLGSVMGRCSRALNVSLRPSDTTSERPRQLHACAALSQARRAVIAQTVCSPHSRSGMTGTAVPAPALPRSGMSRRISQRMPAGSNAVEIVPWNGSSARRNSPVPKPRRCGALTGGPPLSLHSILRVSPSWLQDIDTLPPGSLSAPYLAALVASS